jgi:hypothetical protein
MKNIKNLIFLFVSILFLGACNFAKFDKAPGNRIESMPTRLIGTYEVKYKGPIGQIDTFKVSLDKSSILIFSNNDMKEFAYGRDYLLYEIEEFTVISFPDVNFKKLRNLIVLEPDKKGVKLYPIVEKVNPFGGIPEFDGIFPQRTTMVNQEQFEIKQDNGGMSFEMDAIGQENNFQIGFYQMEDPQFTSLFRTKFKDKNYIFMNKFIPPSISQKQEKSKRK